MTEESKVKFPISYYADVPFEAARATGYRNGIYEITVDGKAMPEDTCDNPYSKCDGDTRNPDFLTSTFQKQLIGVLDQDNNPVGLKDLPEQTREILERTTIKITLCLEHLAQMILNKKL